MLSSILQVVLFPIILGLVVRAVLKHKVESLYFGDALNFCSGDCADCRAAIIGGSKAQILESGLLILAVVALHNAIGYLLGFAAAQMFHLPACRL